MPSRGRQTELLGPWEWWRKLFLAAICLLGIFGFVVVNIPIGVVAATLLFGASFIWKSPYEITNPLLGTYTGGTIPYFIAVFFEALKIRRREVLGLSSLGFGPPVPDPDHKLSPGVFPPTRMSSYWALLASCIIGIADPLAIEAHYLFWGDFQLPWWALYALSSIGWFIAIQTILGVRRFQGDKESISSIEPKPATMLHKIHYDQPILPVLGKSLIYGISPTIVVWIVWYMVKWPVILTTIGTGTIVVGIMCIMTSKMFQDGYLGGWKNRAERREFWTNTFSFMRGGKEPVMVDETSWPTLEDWQEQAPENEPFNPSVQVATFLFPPNATFDDYYNSESRIQGALNASLVAIVPIGMHNEAGEEVPGTIGSQGFRVWWTESDPPYVMDPELDPWMREFMCRAKIMPQISRVRGISYCDMYSCNVITRAGSEQTILEIRVSPEASGVGLSSFLNKTNELERELGVEWVRCDEIPGVEGERPIISIYMGQRPVPGKTRFINPASMMRKRIDKRDWAYYFATQGVAGTNGLPRLLERKPTTDVVDKLTFTLPDGLPFAAVERTLEPLKTTSGNAFMEIEMADDGIQIGSNDKLDKSTEIYQPPKFNIIAARRDPLERIFNFVDYQDQLLIPREKGVANINWSPGVLADDTLGIYKWDHELPHLLVAGASGMGKSVIMNNMICQLAHNNYPTEVEIWGIEPKNEMQVYQNMDVFRKFVDSWSPDENFIFNAAELSYEAVTEMNRRYRLMRDHPKFPKKLAKARQIAIRESEMNGTRLEDHPLYLPYIFMIIEECATLFADAASKDEREDQGRLIAYIAEIARKARAAGIYLVCATQYPTNASIPSVIRNQMRRIGLGCQNGIASRVVIDENGLEEIKVAGQGKMTAQRGRYRKFRGFWLRDGDPDDGESNDILDILQRIPNKHGVLNGSGSSIGSVSSRLIVPNPSESVFNSWDQSVGAKLKADLDRGKNTPSRYDI